MKKIEPRISRILIVLLGFIALLLPQNSMASTNYSYTMPAKNNFFITKEIGWKGVYDAQGMFKEDMTLYHTTNGGKTWIKLADTNKKKTIPYTGDKTGMSFISKSKGWITTYAPWEGKFGFLETNDGGRSWHDVKMTVPKLFAHTEIYANAPLIISPTDALLAAFPTGGDSRNHLLIYFTHNAGKTWTPYADKTSGISGGIHWITMDKSLKKLNVSNKDSEWNFDGKKWTKK